MATIPPIQHTLRDGRCVTIRTVTLDDVPAMHDFLEHMALTSEHNVIQPGEVKFDPEKQRERMREILERAGSLWLVACDPEGRLVGEIMFRNPDRSRIAHHGHFGISVHTGWRSRGLGEALIRILLDWARRSEVVEQVCLGVFANNERAIRLYRRMGFVEIGRRPREFKMGPGRYIDDIQMMQFVKPESHFAPRPDATPARTPTAESTHAH